MSDEQVWLGRQKLGHSLIRGAPTAAWRHDKEAVEKATTTSESAIQSHSRIR